MAGQPGCELAQRLAVGGRGEENSKHSAKAEQAALITATPRQPLGSAEAGSDSAPGELNGKAIVYGSQWAQGPACQRRRPGQWERPAGLPGGAQGKAGCWPGPAA